MVNSVRWYGHVLRKEDGHVLRRALGFLRLKVEEEMEAEEDLEDYMKVGLSGEDASCQSKWSVGVNLIAT